MSKKLNLNKTYQLFCWFSLNIVLAMWIWNFFIGRKAFQHVAPHFSKIQRTSFDRQSKIDNFEDMEKLAIKSVMDLKKKHEIPNFVEIYESEYFAMLAGVYNKSNTIVAATMDSNDIGGFCPLNEVDFNYDAYSLLLHEYGIPDFKDINWGKLDKQLSPTQCNQTLGNFVNSIKVRKELLVILTTCNHLDMTIATLHSLEKVNDQFDILVIDDHSVDDTITYLRKKGYAVITKSHGKGLTDSWNLGYRSALQMGYKYVIYTNNDVIVPSGAIDIMRIMLNKNVLVVPLSTTEGAGHNPGQSTIQAHNLSAQMYSNYVNNPVNAPSIQQKLTSLFYKADEDKYAKISKWEDTIKFNGFFFGVQLAKIQDVAFDGNNLFDPSSIMVQQEDLLMTRMKQLNLFPVISMYSFIYHYKSATVKASGYIMGNKNETRNDLSLYHPELKRSEYSFPFISSRNSDSKSSNMKNEHYVITKKSLSHLYKNYEDRMYRLDTYESYPAYPQSITIAMAVSDPVRNSAAGDIYTAMELSHVLVKGYHVNVKFLHEGKDWYDLQDVDILVSFLDQYNIDNVKNAKPNLITIAWMRNWFHRWMSRIWIGNYDILLTSSAIANQFFNDFIDFPISCNRRCPPSITRVRQRIPLLVHTFRIGTNPSRFMPGPASSKFKADYVFTENYWDAKRDMMDFNPLAVEQYVGAVVGKNWKNAPVSGAWQRLVRGEIPYRLIPMVYRSAKIVIDDANHVTKPWGSINSRVFDAIAAGSLVVTNGWLGGSEIFGNRLPVFYNTTDLAAKLTYYLSNETLRLETINDLRKIVIERHTYEIRAEQFGDIVNSVIGWDIVKRRSDVDIGSSDVSNSKSDSIIYMDITQKYMLSEYEREVGSKFMGKGKTCAEERLASICIGVRVYPGSSISWLNILIQGIISSYEKSEYSKSLGVIFYIINTDVDDDNRYTNELKKQIDAINAKYDKCYVRLFYDTAYFNPEDSKSKSNNAKVNTNVNSLDRDMGGNSKLYGYDTSDNLLHYFKQKDICEWIMFTNGDNMYNSAWFESVAPYALDGEHQLIGWDFVSHHIRDGNTEQTIPVALKRGYIDLGSVMIRRQAFITSQAKFLPESVFTTDIHARDYFLVSKIMSSMLGNNLSDPSTVSAELVNRTSANFNTANLSDELPHTAKLIHKVLLFHQ